MHFSQTLLFEGRYCIGLHLFFDHGGRFGFDAGRVVGRNEDGSVDFDHWGATALEGDALHGLQDGVVLRIERVPGAPLL